MPVLRGEDFLVAPEQRVGSEADVVFGDAVEMQRAVLAVQGEHAQARREAFGFALPVEDERGRKDDQRRPVEASAFLFEQQVGQRLRRFAEPHVVGEDAGEAVPAQVLQPVDAFLLVGAQFEREAGRRRRPFRRARAGEGGGEALHGVQPFAAPGAAVDDAGEALGVEFRDAQLAVGGQRVEEVDQGARQRLEAPGRDGEAPVLGVAEDDAFLVVDVGQVAGVEPARIALEEGVEQGRQFDALAFDLDAERDVEPRVAVLGQRADVEVPFARLLQVVPEVAGEVDLPAAFAQARREFAEEARPGVFALQAEQALGGGAAVEVQGVARRRGEAEELQFGEVLLLFGAAPLDAHRFAVGQGGEFGAVVRGDGDAGVVEVDQRVVVGDLPVACRVLAMRGEAPEVGGAQAQDGNRRGFDLADGASALAARRGQVRRGFAQHFGDHGDVDRRQRGQGEQAREHARRRVAVQDAGLSEAGVDVPGRLGRGDVRGGRVGQQAGAQQLAFVALPVEDGRALGRRGERLVGGVGAVGGVAEVGAAGGDDVRQEFGAVPAGQGDVAVQAVAAGHAQDEAEDVEVDLVDELRRRDERPFEVVPHGGGGVAPVVGVDAAFQQVQVQALVPGVGGDDVVDRLRRADAGPGFRARLPAGGRAQGLGPLHDFRVDARRLVAFAQRHQHDRGGVLAGVAHRARAGRLDQPALADLGEHRGVGDEADVDLVRLRDAALHRGLDAAGL